MLQQLYTARGENLKGTPWSVYPRPQMKRPSYINLNGTWEFGLMPKVYDRKIQVPFCPESVLSDVREHFPEGSDLFYRRFVTLSEGFRNGRLLLHIGAADQIAQVYVNGDPVGDHRGIGSFCVDVTEQWQTGENEITVCCKDDLKDQSFPYGKQTMNRGGMWYTPVSGIWQTVWMESVPETYIEKLNIENCGYSVTISVVPALNGKVTVADLGEFPLVNGSVTITPESPRLWSPEDPYLYEFSVECGEDKVESYFAVRSLEIKRIGDYPRLCLNGKPYFFHALLDQGYWPDGILTPAAPECYADDILAMKKLGFNTLRKHIKIEAEEFYYQCDKLGMIVFQDMINNSDYGYIRDTVLPTVFPEYQKRSDKKLHTNEVHRRRFLEAMETTVEQLKNHPCICYWTIFNEGWGQFDSDTVYEQFKKLDDTRFIDSTSGWFRRKKSDVDSRHVYFRKVNLKGDGKKPLILSEFGGKTLRIDGHVFNPDKTYGYGGCKTTEALNEALVKLYMLEVLPCVKNGLCGTVYTQISDVEDEINGLVTYDRRVLKLDPQKMGPVASALQEAILEDWSEETAFRETLKEKMKLLDRLGNPDRSEEFEMFRKQHPLVQGMLAYDLRGGFEEISAVRMWEAHGAWGYLELLSDHRAVLAGQMLPRYVSYEEEAAFRWKYLDESQQQLAVRYDGEFDGLRASYGEIKVRIQQIRKKISKEYEKKWKRYWQGLEPRMRKIVAYELARWGCSRGQSGFHGPVGATDVPFPFCFCGWADYYDPDWKHDTQGVGFRIEPGCFAGRSPKLFYREDSWDHGCGWQGMEVFMDLVRRYSSGLCDVQMERLEDSGGMAMTFRLDPTLVRETIKLDGGDVPTAQVGSYIFVLPRCGEFNCELGEILDGKPVVLHRDDFCMK